MSRGVCDDQEIINGILATPLDKVFDMMIASTKQEGVKHKEWYFRWSNVKITVNVALTKD